MPLDEQIVDMIRDRFNQVDRDNTEILAALKSHTEKDEGYWRRIDDQHAQLRLAKWVGGSGAFAAATAWLYEFFKGR